MRRIGKAVPLALICAIAIVSSMSSGLFAQDFPYDPNAVVDRSKEGTIMNGYLVNFNMTGQYVYFRNPENPAINYATYNAAYQYWEFVGTGFDPAAIDLASLFLSIDLSKTTLNRMQPASRTMAAAEDDPQYDWAKDKDFADFVAWMRARKTPQATIDFYLAAAANPGKRGKLLPWSVMYTDAEVGLQAENLKPIKYKNVLDGSRWTKEEARTAGGMQYYFELRKRDYARGSDAAYNLFRDSGVVPITLVELVPNDRREYKIGALSGTALQTRVGKDFQAFFGGKKCKVSRVSIKVDYSLLEDRMPSAAELEAFMDAYVHKSYPKYKSLFIYYFVDPDGLAKIDDDMSHPLEMGSYGCDWSRYYRTILHELGHTLGMRHHFDTETEGAADLDRHCSPACVMNYKFVKEGFCELCLYGLGM
jgi:hypothetical protein